YTCVPPVLGVPHRANTDARTIRFDVLARPEPERNEPSKGRPVNPLHTDFRALRIASGVLDLMPRTRAEHHDFLPRVMDKNASLQRRSEPVRRGARLQQPRDAQAAGLRLA